MQGWKNDFIPRVTFDVLREHKGGEESRRGILGEFTLSYGRTDLKYGL